MRWEWLWPDNANLCGDVTAKTCRRPSAPIGAGSSHLGQLQPLP